MLTIIAPAKVNLFLGIGSIRDDGYHDLVGVFHTLELADKLTLLSAEPLSVRCEPDVGVPAESNLAYRAAVEFARECGREPSGAITIAKHIPHGAGLGGGSSDAAAVIAGLAHAWGIDLRDERLTRAGARLGADVPFFLGESGCALMVGRGDEAQRDVTAFAGVPLVVVKPATGVSTAEAYRAFDVAPAPAGDPGSVLGAVESQDARALGAALSNNMEAASCAVAPEIGEVRSWLAQHHGVLGVAVAGSGSAVFGVCESGDAAAVISAQAHARGWWGCATALGAGAVVIGGAST